MANSSPAVVNGKVFFGGSGGTLHCVRQITSRREGELLWSYRAAGRIWSAPAVAYGRVFFTSLDGFLYCLGENRGELIWKAPIGPLRIMTSSPCVANGQVYVGSETGYLYAFDALSDDPEGDLQWAFLCEGWIHGSPALAGGRVYVGTAGPRPAGGYRLFCLRAETTDPEGELIWSFRIGDRANGMFITPAVWEEKVYLSADDGWMRCLDGRTGDVVWQRFVREMDAPSPAIAYGRVYKSYEARGGIDCWEAVPAGDPEGDGELVWSYDTPEVDRSGVTVADGKVLHTTWYDKLYCFDAFADTPVIRWIYSPIDVPAQQVGAAPSIANGMIFVGDGNSLRALRPRAGNLPPLVEAEVATLRGLEVTFRASATDLDGAVVSWRWGFGDGESSEVQDPTHTYRRAGYYVASVRVTDDAGMENEATVFVALSGKGRALFLRGDPNGDGRADITDAVYLLGVLFRGQGAFSCSEASDADNDGSIRLSDAVVILTYLFRGGPPPQPPGPPPAPCGQDPDPPGSSGDLGCETYAGC